MSQNKNMMKKLIAIFIYYFLSVTGLIISVKPCKATYKGCACAVQKFERQYNMPDNLLMAISLVESGRMMPKQGVVAWPWTINANGKSYMFPTKAEAILKVRQLRANGITSIDVGCMQINLKHHPNAFSSLENAFDPDINVAYAARFLFAKKLDTGSWHKAIGHYHSAVAHINAPYKNRVFKVWEKLNKTYTPGSFIPTVFTAAFSRHEGEYKTHIITNEAGSKKVPVRVQFGPYTGLQRGVQSVAIVKQNMPTSNAPQVSDTPPTKPQATFFKINGGTQRPQIKPLIHKPILQKARFRLKKQSSNGFFTLSE